MAFQLETDRLILREIISEDAASMFELDSDPDVHNYLGNKPITHFSEAEATIRFIQDQYKKYGIGRWAVVEKQSGEFIGWSGFKYITEITNGKTQYYDLGYRFLRRFWDKGYATEAAMASLKYAYESLTIREVYAIADVRNRSSISVLKKVGFSTSETFLLNGLEHF